MRGFTIASVITLVIVVVVAGIAAALLAKTVKEAQAINGKAQRIAKNGKGINSSTDSVMQLTRTNKLAKSILNSAKPLDGQLGGIVATAQGIDGLAGSINTTAGTINTTARSINTTAGTINNSAGSINNSAGRINSVAGTINSQAGSINNSAVAINGSAGRINSSAARINGSAGRINSSAGSINTSAGSINSSAGSILSVARKIDTDVKLINTNLNVTLDLVTDVKADSGNILGLAKGANDTAACIDFKVFGSQGEDGDCKGLDTPMPTSRGVRDKPQLEDMKKLQAQCEAAAKGDSKADEGAQKFCEGAKVGKSAGEENPQTPTSESPPPESGQGQGSSPQGQSGRDQSGGTDKVLGGDLPFTAKEDLDRAEKEFLESLGQGG